MDEPSPRGSVTSWNTSTYAMSSLDGPLTARWANPVWRQLLPAVLFLMGAWLVLSIDLPLARALVREGRLRGIHPVLERLEGFGDALVAALIVGAVALCDPKNRKFAPRLLCSALGGGLMADVVKLIIVRTRPNDHLLTGSVWSTFGRWLPGHTAGFSGQSFPSAHTALATGLCLGLVTLYPRGRAFFVAITACVALQRMETGAHYLSDTLVGAAVGYLTALALFRPAPIGFWFDRFEGFTKSTTNSATAVETPSEAAAPIHAMRRLDASSPPVRHVSAVIPVYNEELNIALMYERLAPVLDTLPATWEMIFVDDGSRDGTDRKLQSLARADHRVKIVTFRRNYGQTAAMSAGIRHATGDAVVLLDGDLQNDPTDIPKMIDKLGEGFDLVHGWRKERHDRFLDRRLPSMIANWIISRTTGFPVHDLGCTLKVIRTEIAQELHLYGEMHRFIPILAHHRGARCVEVVTRHHARQFGTSKYGISRTFRVMFDLLTVQFITKYLSSPMKYFGRIGLACFGVCGLSGAATIAMKIWQATDMTGNPLLLACVFAGMVGVQFLSIGLLGELLSRIYFASQDRANYTIRKRVNLDSREADGNDRPLSAVA